MCRLINSRAGSHNYNHNHNLCWAGSHNHTPSEVGNYNHHSPWVGLSGNRRIRLLSIKRLTRSRAALNHRQAGGVNITNGIQISLGKQLATRYQDRAASISIMDTLRLG